jgi:hypothetical protein
MDRRQAVVTAARRLHAAEKSKYRKAKVALAHAHHLKKTTISTINALIRTLRRKHRLARRHEVKSQRAKLIAFRRKVVSEKQYALMTKKRISARHQLDVGKAKAAAAHRESAASLQKILKMKLRALHK